MVKLVLIGAGSAVFGKRLLIDVLSFPELPLNQTNTTTRILYV